MFNRQARKFTELYPKTLETYGNDEYAAKWLTRIYNPGFKVKCVMKDKPEIKANPNIVCWSKQRKQSTEPMEVF